MEDAIAYSLETEKAVLAAILNDPDAYSQISSFIDAGAFYSTDHKAIFDAIASTIERCGTPDLATVYEELAGCRILQRKDVAEYLAELVVGVPGGGDILQHVRILLEHELRRILLDILASNAELLRDTAMNPLDIFDGLTSRLEAMGRDGPFHLYRSLREERAARIGDLIGRLEERGGN